MLSHEAERYVLDVQPELRQLVRDLCAIPAPSHHEQARAAFCRDWFVKNGAKDAYIDDALNVICPCGVTEDGDIAVFMAHTDTVFPDLEPMPFIERDGKMFSPGVTDDTANLAVLMVCARWAIRRGCRGLLFVANSCEEGLGNLKGCREIMRVYGDRVRELITLDGTNLRSVVNEAVGSHRYRVEVRTEGGHSFGDFGRRNAIQALSAMVGTLYSITVPVEGNSRTTYNVGLISGGTSINTIAQQAEMYYEYRSDRIGCLKQMEAVFRRVIENYRNAGLEVIVERIGERPCAGEIDPDARRALLNRAVQAVFDVTGREAVFSSGSTDANIPLSMGIPAICISACSGGGCHTREEWLDVDSLADGCRLCLNFLQPYCQGVH